MNAQYDADENLDSFESALGKAIHSWHQGRHIPAKLAAELMAEGFDVGALEAHHFNH